MPPAKPLIPLDDAQRKLVEDNHNLIYGFLRDKHLPGTDYYDLMAIAMCRAAVAYNGTAKFSTFAYKCMKYALAHELRTQSFMKRSMCRDVGIDKIVGLSSPSFIEDSCSDCDFQRSISKLGAQQKRVISALAAGERAVDVGKSEGVSYQRIYQIKKKALQIICA